MIGDVKMQTTKQKTRRSLTGDRPLFLALLQGPRIPSLPTYNQLIISRFELKLYKKHFCCSRFSLKIWHTN